MNQVGFRVSQSKCGEQSVNVIADIDFQHILFKGVTGSGKTASLVLPTLLDRLGRGHSIIFFDHKGHEHKKVKVLAKEAGRLKDVVEIGKPHAGHINILAEMDTVELKNLIKEVASSKDPYWSNSAASLAEDILVPLRQFYDLLSIIKEHHELLIEIEPILRRMKDLGIDMHKEPSFQTLSNIVSSVNNLMVYVNILTSMPKILEKRFILDNCLHKISIEEKRELLAKVYALKKSIKNIERFSLDDKSNNSSGNNGVLQILDNALASYAKKDYLNREEYSIKDLIDNRIILIIDTQSFGEDILKVLFESILKKSVMRLRTETQMPLSVFIDEANRVLSSSFDLHNDVLREAKVELILAIQNEEQMMIKFTPIVWNSIKHNIKHHYAIDRNHNTMYKDKKFRTEPLIISNDKQNAVEYEYYALPKNRVKIQENFLSSSSQLPQSFTVLYDLDLFTQESAIILQEKNGMEHIFRYYGEDIVSSVYERYPKKSKVYIEDEIPNSYTECAWYKDEPMEEDEEDDYDEFGIFDGDEDDEELAIQEASEDAELYR